MKRARLDRNGFTLVELVVVVLIVGILASLAMPRLSQTIVRARAAAAVGDLNVVRVAVLNYQADQGGWPSDVSRGVTPPGLGPYLPEDFEWTSPLYTIDYDNWSTATETFVGFSVIADDEELGRQILRLLGGNAWSDDGERVTWLIAWTG